MALQTSPILGERIFVVHDVLSSEECLAFIERTEALGFDLAPINTFHGPQIRTNVRNNRRVMVDNYDWAERIWHRVQHLFPDPHPKAIGLNERFRFYRYDPGERFAPHFDGFFQRPGTRERSIYSFMVYLNEEFTGGVTRFLQHDCEVVPRTGMGCFFVHDLLHEGVAVQSGRKYVLRSDVMFDLRRI